MRFKVAKNIVRRKLENEVVILNLKNGLYYVLNDTAGSIWDGLFVDNRSAAQVVGSIAGEYRTADKNVIQKDMNEQLDYWLKENLIVKA